MMSTVRHYTKESARTQPLVGGETSEFSKSCDLLGILTCYTELSFVHATEAGQSGDIMEDGENSPRALSMNACTSMMYAGAAVIATAIPIPRMNRPSVITYERM